jgi:hypothetical protein
MTPELLKAYRAVAEDLTRRSDKAQENGAPRRFIQSLENTRAVVMREAGIEEL